MKLRQIKQNFWWTWRCEPVYPLNKNQVPAWGIARIKHQIRNKSK